MGDGTCRLDEEQLPEVQLEGWNGMDPEREHEDDNECECVLSDGIGTEDTSLVLVRGCS